MPIYQWYSLVGVDDVGQFDAVIFRLVQMRQHPFVRLVLGFQLVRVDRTNSEELAGSMTTACLRLSSVTR